MREASVHCGSRAQRCLSSVCLQSIDKSQRGKADPDASSSAAEQQDPLLVVQSKNRRLRAFLQTLHWPRLKHFEANGKDFDLPIRCQREPVGASRPTPATPLLQYLAGFFDGDGCVSHTSDLSGCYLSVSQSFDQAAVLILFFDAFGGSIVRNKDGRGLQKPTLRWTVYGGKACWAASLLSLYSVAKQKQLLLAAQWPDATWRKEGLKAELVALKQYDSAVPQPCSWQYFSGFFDAEGCISMKGRSALELQVHQKFPTVLRCLHVFLVDRIGGYAHMLESGHGASILGIFSTAACKQMLKAMLEAGLLCKAPQAELSVRMNALNAAQVRAELVTMTGNQKFGKALDEVGQERARHIKSLQRSVGRTRHRGDLQAATAKLAQVKELKQEHLLFNARLENQQLLEYVLKIETLHVQSWTGPRARREAQLEQGARNKRLQHQGYHLQP